MVFFDLPGFNDTGTTGRHLTNAAFIKRIITQAASIRVVCVAGQDEITGGRGKLVKEFFDVVQDLFPNNSGFLSQSSVFVVTKSDQSDITTLFEFCKAKVAPQYLKLIEQWYNAERFFQMKKPDQGRIDEMYKGAVLQALRHLPKQEVRRVNIGRIHPSHIEENLAKVFVHVMADELGKSKKEPDEKLSALKVVMSRFDENFWETFKNRIGEKTEVALLRDLSEHAYNQALEDFETNHFEAVNQLTKRWEIQYDSSLQKYQAIFDKLLYNTVKGYLVRIRQDIGLDDDIAQGNLNDFLRKLETQSGDKATFLSGAQEVIRNSREIKTEIDKDQESLQSVFADCLQEFVSAHLGRQVDDFLTEISKKKEILRIQIQTKQLGEEVSRKQSEIQKIKSDIEEDRNARKALESKVAQMNTDSDSYKRQLSSLQEEIEAGKKRLKAAEDRANASMPPYGGYGMGGYQPSFFDMFSTMPSSSGMSSGFSGGHHTHHASMPHTSMPSSSGGFNHAAIARAYNAGGVTQRQVAQQFGCSQSTVSRAVAKHRK